VSCKPARKSSVVITGYGHRRRWISYMIRYNLSPISTQLHGSGAGHDGLAHLTSFITAAATTAAATVWLRVILYTLQTREEVLDLRIASLFQLSESRCLIRTLHLGLHWGNVSSSRICSLLSVKLHLRDKRTETHPFVRLSVVSVRGVHPITGTKRDAS